MSSVASQLSVLGDFIAKDADTSCVMMYINLCRVALDKDASIFSPEILRTLCNVAEKADSNVKMLFFTVLQQCAEKNVSCLAPMLTDVIRVLRNSEASSRILYLQLCVKCASADYKVLKNVSPARLVPQLSSQSFQLSVHI